MHSLLYISAENFTAFDEIKEIDQPTLNLELHSTAKYSTN